MSTESTRLENFEADDYGVGIGLSRVIAFIGWLMAGIGVLLALATVKDAVQVSLLVLLPHLYLIVGGVFVVASGQASRAVMDGANNAKRILIVSKQIRDELRTQPPLTE